jgi:hypothetical protein
MLNNMTHTEYSYQNQQRKIEVQMVERRIEQLRLAEQTRRNK